MKRDMELVRKILLVVEESDSPPGILRIDGYQDSIVWHHVWLLGTANMLLVDRHGTPHTELPQATPICLTWQGAEFLAAARDETTWNSAKKRIGTTFVSTSMAVISKVLAEIACQQLGLKP